MTYVALTLCFRAGFRGGAGGPGPQASHQKGASHQSCIKYSTNKYQYQYQYITFKYQYQYKYCA